MQLEVLIYFRNHQLKSLRSWDQLGAEGGGCSSESRGVLCLGR